MVNDRAANAMKTHTNKEVQMQAFRNQCRRSGLKVTPQRMAVYEALVSTDSHPTAEEVYRQVRKTFSSISLDTVNRTLLTLAEIGAAFVVEGTGQPRRFDGGLEDHQHFRCLKCQKIEDFCHLPYNRIEVPEHLSEQFTILRKTVYFEGLCADCGAAAKKEPEH